MNIETKETIVTDGLVLHLDSWNNSSYSGSGSTWNDLSNGDNNASLVGGYSYSDKSLSFTDTGYVNIPDSSDFDFSGDFSLESWFYLTETPDGTFPSAIFASWQSAFTGNDKIILFVNSSLQIVLQVNTASNQLIYPSTISLNQWYHIVVSRVNGIINIYLDGQVGTSLSYSSSIDPILDMRIGGYEYQSDPLGQSFVGKIPVARIYKNRGLTSKEVTQHYITQKGRFFGQSNTILSGDGLSLTTSGIPLRITGMIFSSVSWSRPVVTSTFLDPNATSATDYNENYGLIKPYQTTNLVYAYQIGTITGGFSSTGSDAFIVGPHVFSYFNLNWTLRLNASNGCWFYDKCNASIEFLDQFDNVVCALQTVNRGSFTYSHNLKYGANLGSLTNTATVGTYPNTDGYLTFTPNSIIFTNIRSTNYNSSFTFNCDMSSVRKIRVSNVHTQCTWNSGVCRAYVYLKIVF